MTRTEFLATLGLGMISLMGLDRVVNLLVGHRSGSGKHNSYGYGSSAYGGGKESSTSDLNKGR